MGSGGEKKTGKGEDVGDFGVGTAGGTLNERFCRSHQA